MSNSHSLGQLLLVRGCINQDQLRIALLEQKTRNLKLGECLIDLGFVSESDVRHALSDTLGVKTVNINTVQPEPVALTLLTAEQAKSLVCLPLKYDENTASLSIAVADVHNLPLIDQLRSSLTKIKDMTLFLADKGGLETAIDTHYGHALDIETLLQALGAGDDELLTLSDEQARDNQHPIVCLVEAILIDAIKRRASDVHFEPATGFLQIRYRIDGVMQLIRRIHSAVWPAMLVRLKVLGEMDISETRLPQDGQMSLSVNQQMIDIRFSTMPVQQGEAAVLRILGRSALRGLEQLYLTERIYKQLKQLALLPGGMLLLSGPTGSGKTTTLYALLQKMDVERQCIMTLEDPVEIPWSAIRQSSLKKRSPMDMAAGIKAMLRQDPDVLLIGEIRESIVAKNAFSASMTGHKLLTSLHSGSAISSLSRLTDLGISSATMAEQLTAVVNQRLIRRLCKKCKLSYRNSPEQAAFLGWTSSQLLYRSDGCESCHKSGFSGRIPLLEILAMTPHNKKQLFTDQVFSSSHVNVKQLQMTSLQDQALEWVLKGETSLHEVARVIPIQRVESEREVE